MRTYNSERQRRDIYTKTAEPSAFDDTQLKKSIEVLTQEMAKAAGGTPPADAAPAAPDAEKKPADEKKKAARIPFFPTTLKYVM